MAKRYRLGRVRTQILSRGTVHRMATTMGSPMGRRAASVVLTRIPEADLLTDRMSRRAFLRAGGAGAAALTLGSAVPAATALAGSKGLGVYYQAYWEYMPMRRAQRARNGSIQLFRELPFGDLADVVVAGTRQFRTDQPCDDKFNSVCAGMDDPAQTLPACRRSAGWSTASPARAHAGPSSPSRYADPGWPIVASELVATSITSGGDGNDTVQDAALRENPWIKFNANRRGYVRCTMTRKQYVAEFRTLPYVSTPGAPAQTKAAFVLQDGQPGLQPA